MADELSILPDEPIPVSFDTRGYTFWKGVRGVIGTPVEASLKLVAVKGDEKVEIKTVADLKDRVVIASPEQALGFVRLFTSLDTHYLFDDVGYIEPRLARNGPGPGECTAEYEARMNVRPISVRQDDDAFVVERHVLERTGRLVRVVERVGRNGEYSLERATTIDERSPIHYPAYE
jgi:hypothetical protein